MARTITHQGNDETKTALFGSNDHLEISQSNTFTQMVFELLTEREPTDSETKMLDLILNLSIDHGPNSPSGIETVKAAKDGKTLSEALAAGIMQINEHHGGAGEPLMEIIYRIKNHQSSVMEEIKKLLNEGKRLPGVGHRVYKDKDPRAELIMERALELGVAHEEVKIVKSLKEELLKQSGKSLPINIDGALAAVFCGFGLKPEVGIAVFLIARTPGLIGQYLNHKK